MVARRIFAAMDLVLDIGNTRIKAGLFQGAELLRTGHVAHGDLAGLKAFADRSPVERIAVGSVAREDQVLLGALGSWAPTVVIAGDHPSPLRMAYRTPTTLGVDRLANAVAVAHLFPGRAALAIDLGTCVTYDHVDAAGTYRGGSISPGLRMRARAMHAHSARLPLVAPPEQPAAIGLSTEESLAAGVHHGLRAELKTLIAEARQQAPDLAVVLTGGDAPRFARALENGIFAHPTLTLLGLHALLGHPRTPAPAGVGH